jgi:hypothetical protein
MPGLRKYKTLCHEVDIIQANIGLQALCRNCYTENPGCCVFCKYSEVGGCSTMSLGCKLWLCKDKMKTVDQGNMADLNGGRNTQIFIKQFPVAVNRLREIFNFGVKNHWIQCRKGIEEIKAGERLEPIRFIEGFQYLNGTS